MSHTLKNIIRLMIEARQLEANRQIAEMQLASYSGEELSGLRMVKTSPKERQGLTSQQVPAAC
jgi:hypothetical protein